MTLEEALAQIEALKTKNAEVLGEKKRAADKASELEARMAKLEEDRNADKTKAEEEIAKKSGDWEKVKAALEAKHASEVKTLKDENEALKGARDKMVLDGTLSKALEEVGVKPEFKDAVIAMMRAQQKSAVEIDASGNFVGKIGDKLVSDFVKDFAASDAGKAFVANGHEGGGAEGSGTKGAKSNGNPYHKDSINKTEQGRLEKTDRAKANKLRAEAGLPALA